MGLRACLAGKRRGEKGKLDRNGRFGLPDGPGMGVTVDARQLAKYRLDQ